MIARLINRLMDLRNAQSEAATPAQREAIQREIEAIQTKLDQLKG
jgi:flagellin-like hook-associated protein FlgL